MASPALDECTILVVVDNETDTLSSIDDGVPQMPEIARRVARLPSARTVNGHLCKEAFSDLCIGCHGFSALVSGRRGDEQHTVLFDVGPSDDVWLANAGRLGVDLGSIEAVFLSHWHADHSGALPGVVGAIARARGAANRPAPVVHLHPDRPDQRGLLLPSGVLVLMPPEPTLEAIAAAGGEIELHAEPSLLGGGFFAGSGAIPRVTAYETGLAGHHSIRGDDCIPDPLIMDERYLALRVARRGVTVLSACSHAGVVNASLDARRVFDDEAADLILGGYHLAGKAMEPRIEPTVRDLKERIAPNVVAPGHCTGWRAKAALAAAFAPGHYGPSVVGTSYQLRAS
jgi:7,8-dihydropterin-6-yl-methyl-4-(beta-D-ribofuranosyl)aminobenzene 5'-phosphate synthase